MSLRGLFLGAVAAAGTIGCGDEGLRRGGDDDDGGGGSGGAAVQGSGGTGGDAAGGSSGQGAGGSSGPGGGSASELLVSIGGQWHGSIGANYAGGCLCLSYDQQGNVVEPSGITLGFDVTGGSTVVVDVTAREIDTTAIVDGSTFHIREAIVDPGATAIEGLWEGDPPTQFDDTILLDRLPQTCEERTGLTGAPC